MGTNYYLHIGPCGECGRPKEVIHIGKSSMGWTFSFHGTEEIRSYQDWIKFIEKTGGIIRDEYNEVMSLEEFKEWVKEGFPHTSVPIKNEIRDYFERLWGEPNRGYIWKGYRIRTLQDDLESGDAIIMNEEDLINYDGVPL